MSTFAHSPNWSKLPAPANDGAADHLTGMSVPDIPLQSTDGRLVSLVHLFGRTVVFAFPRPGTPMIPLEQWDAIPGARGCTSQNCAFRDLEQELHSLGVEHLFGLSTQDTNFQQQFAALQHLPFPLLSDQHLRLANAMNLPTMEVAGQTMIKRLTLVIDSGRVTKVFYPVFPPDKNAEEVLQWIRG